MLWTQPIAEISEQAHGLVFAGLNPLDWSIVVVVAFSAFTAFLRGLVRSLISLAGVLLGLLLGAWYAAALAGKLLRWIPEFRFAEIAAFLLILAACFAMAMLTGRLLRSACEAIGLGFADRLAGAAFGTLRAVLLLSSILLPLSNFLPALPLARNSVLLPYLRSAAHGVSFVLPQHFEDWFTPGALAHFPASAQVPDRRKCALKQSERDDTAQGDRL